MSLEDFFQSIRIAQRLLARSRATTDSPRLEASAIASSLHQADLWLTPRIVSDYNPDDLFFLTQVDRQKVDDAVRRFREIARDVPPDEPAPPEKGQKARNDLETIVGLVNPHRYRDSQEWMAATLLDRFTRTPYTRPSLQALRYEFDTTLDGTPLLVIYLIVDDALPHDRKRFSHETAALRGSIDDYFGRHGVTLRTLCYFRTVSEEAQVHKKTVGNAAAP